jgi:hypothetical protein
MDEAAGRLVNNTIPWRGDSALRDGEEAKLDLSKGMYDAGDHMKFGFTLAFTGTMLSWSVLEYGDAMRAAQQRDAAMDALGWIMEFLVNAHPSDDVLYIQVIDAWFRVHASRRSRISSSSSVLQSWSRPGKSDRC